MNSVPDLHATSYDRLLACVPYLLGWHPRHAVVVLGISAGGDVVFTTHHRASDDHGEPIEVDFTPATLAEATSCIVVAYRDAASDLAVMASTVKACNRLSEAGVAVPDVLLVTGQHWSARDCRADRCDHDDHWLTRDHPTAKQLAADGRTTLRDRDAVAAQLDPVDDDRRHAAEDAYRILAEEIDGDDDARLRLLDHAVDVMHAHGQSDWALPAADDVADLAGAVWHRDVVTTACRLVDADGAYSARRHLELWRWVVRHLSEHPGAAAAALCAYAAWRAGDGVLARAALQRCHRSYALPLAEYMHHVLHRCVDPHSAAPFS